MLLIKQAEMLYRDKSCLVQLLATHRLSTVSFAEENHSLLSLSAKGQHSE